MQIKSSDFGVIEVSQDRVIDFPAGLPGFETSRRFVLVHQEGGSGEVFTLQSVDEPEVAFSIAAPQRLGVNLEFSLNAEDRAQLAANSADELTVAIIVRSQSAARARPKRARQEPV